MSTRPNEPSACSTDNGLEGWSCLVAMLFIDESRIASDPTAGHNAAVMLRWCFGDAGQALHLRRVSSRPDERATLAGNAGGCAQAESLRRAHPSRRHAGQLVTKQQLLDAVWPGTFVTDAVLKDSIRQLRDALGDDADSPRFIETAHRRGYRFIGRLSNERRRRSHYRSRRRGRDVPPARACESAGVLGRDAELARLNGWLDDALRGERQIVFVTGEPGIGKTTLVSAVHDEAAARGIWMAWGQCLEHTAQAKLISRCSTGSRAWPARRVGNASPSCCGATRRPGFSSCRH